MHFVIIQSSYYIGAEPVSIVAKNPFDGLNYIETTQSELDAARTDPEGPWADAELLAVAQAKLPALFPNIPGGITVSLYVPPPPPIVEPAPPPGESVIVPPEFPYPEGGA